MGRDKKSMAQPLIFTAITGTPITAAPASRTYAKAILSDGFPVDILFDTQLREIALQLDIYPTADQSSKWVFFTDT
jgi:hypothetical protein